MANREYKSDVFSMLLEDRARALDVYNAMAGAQRGCAEKYDV